MAVVTVSSLLAEVYSLTARPDLTSETTLALRACFFLLHRKGKFWKDLVIDWVASAAPVESRSLATHVLDLSGISNMRQVKCIRADGYSHLDFVDVDDQLDAERTLRTDVWWGVGSQIQLRTAISATSWEVSYYGLPTWDGTDVDDWIVDQHQDLLVLNTAQRILSTVGDLELAATYREQAAPLLADLLQDNLEAFAR